MGMERRRGSCGEENCLPLSREEEEGGGVRCEGEGRGGRDSLLCRALQWRKTSVMGR